MSTALQRVTWPVVVVVALVVAAGLGVFALLDPTSRTQVVAGIGSSVKPHVAVFLTTILAALSAWAATVAKRETRAQTEDIREVKANTNGTLTSLRGERDSLQAEVARLRAQAAAATGADPYAPAPEVVTAPDAGAAEPMLFVGQAPNPQRGMVS